MSRTAHRPNLTFDVRRANVHKAIDKFDIAADLDDDGPDYGADFIELLEDESARFDRWLVLVYSDEYEFTFARCYGTKRDALSDLAGTVGDPYGKQPIALVDLDNGKAWTEFALKLTSEGEALSG